MKHGITLRRLFPEAFNGVDFVLRREAGGGLTFENKLLPEHVTLAFLESEWPATAALLGVRETLISYWRDNLTAGERAFLQPIYDAANVLIGRGDVAGAKQIISTAPSISEDLDAKRAAILELFP